MPWKKNEIPLSVSDTDLYAIAKEEKTVTFEISEATQKQLQESIQSLKEIVQTFHTLMEEILKFAREKMHDSIISSAPITQQEKLDLHSIPTVAEKLIDADGKARTVWNGS
ncbi:MAG: hypothetical protein D6767_02935 [Candidatus Hydrogenedentota bacterium]|nr:MAG: hypothetical protein D6767_02935 [Candidatus Hydrogenedentota bacterium]